MINEIQIPKKIQDDTVSKAAGIVKSIQPSKVPPFAPDSTNWEFANTKDPQSIAGIGHNTFLFDENDNLIPNLAITGTEWVNTQTFSTKKELQSSEDLTGYYLKKLQEDRWDYSLTINDKIMRGVAANNPMGNVLAYIKEEENGIRLFVLSTQRDKDDCPCTITSRIFLSNPIKTSIIMDNYGKL